MTSFFRFFGSAFSGTKWVNTSGAIATITIGIVKFKMKSVIIATVRSKQISSYFGLYILSSSHGSPDRIHNPIRGSGKCQNRPEWPWTSVETFLVYSCFHRIDCLMWNQWDCWVHLSAFYRIHKLGGHLNPMHLKVYFNTGHKKFQVIRRKAGFSVNRFDRKCFINVIENLPHESVVLS